MVQVEQITALMDFLEKHRELALGYYSRTNEGRILAKDLWDKCARLLNSVNTNCPNKSPVEWRSFYNEYKCKLSKKIRLQQREQNTKGNEIRKTYSLTPLQQRLYDILGQDLGDPLAPVHRNPLSNIRDYELPCPSTSQNVIETVDISIVKEEPPDQPPCQQYPKKKILKRKRCHHVCKDKNRTTLEDPQPRPEKIKNTYGEPSLAIAESINNLAAAANRIADVLSVLVAPKRKKNHCCGNNNSSCSSDSESDLDK